jgi:post-segregation antitoxin (ccd killing protein)
MTATAGAKETTDPVVGADLQATQQASWEADNGEAIAAYERHLERDGLFADAVRLF